MAAAITKMISYLLIIILGYALKRAKLFKSEHSDIISRIILNITLPCVIITSFQSVNMSGQLLIILVLGFVFNAAMLGVGLFFSRFGKDKSEKTLYRILIPSQNIGFFGIPIAQACFSPTVVASLCAFDVGNAAIMFGPSVILASASMDGRRPTAGSLLKKLFSAPAFDAYLVVIALSFLKITIPTPVLTFAGICGASNAFLAMLFFGLMLEVNFEKSDILVILRIIGVRLATAVALSIPAWFLLPLHRDFRIGIVLCMIMPVATAAAANASSLGCCKKIVSGSASLSLVICSVLALILTAALA